MVLQVFSIFDSVTGTYGTPFFAVNKAVAQRMFSDLANDFSTTVNKNPSDFSLYHIGSFYDDTAHSDVLTPPVLICHATSCLKESSDG